MHGISDFTVCLSLDRNINHIIEYNRVDFYCLTMGEL